MPGPTCSCARVPTGRRGGQRNAQVRGRRGLEAKSVSRGVALGGGDGAMPGGVAIWDARRRQGERLLGGFGRGLRVREWGSGPGARRRQPRHRACLSPASPSTIRGRGAGTGTP
jgi:hypothetical protein